MGHTPNGSNGLKLMKESVEGVMTEIKGLADMKMAKIEKDEAESFAAVKKRHKNELKALKRNFKHRKKKIKDKMAFIEALDPIQFSEQFGDREVPSTLFDSGYECYNEFAQLDLATLERAMKRMTLPSRQMGKSEMFHRTYGGIPKLNAIEVHLD
jgi:hypothetical protein